MSLTLANLLKLSSAILLALSAYFLFAAISARRFVRAPGRRRKLRPQLAKSEEREKTLWVQGELDRAWSLIESPDESEVITGLQILSALGSSIIHLQFFRRIIILMHADNKRVADQALRTVQKVAHQKKTP